MKEKETDVLDLGAVDLWCVACSIELVRVLFLFLKGRVSVPWLTLLGCVFVMYNCREGVIESLSEVVSRVTWKAQFCNAIIVIIKQ
jgi:predicted metal-binding membrane protein